MLRSSNPVAHMQKTYDDCYLICSTAVYFEKQNNEEEALRAWRNALDSIYYTNAYKVPANYRPRNETEKALQESLHDMEVQCKERVDLLDALRRSRLEHPETIVSQDFRDASNTIGQGTIRATEYSDLSTHLQSRPSRPSNAQRLSTNSKLSEVARSKSNSETNNGRTIAQVSRNLATPPPPPPHQTTSRTPSPEKRQTLFKSTLRSQPKDSRPGGRLSKGLRPNPPAAAAAATLAWPVGTPSPMDRVTTDRVDSSSSAGAVVGQSRQTPSARTQSALSSIPPAGQRAGQAVSSAGKPASTSVVPRPASAEPRPTKAKGLASREEAPPRAPLVSGGSLSKTIKSVEPAKRGVAKIPEASSTNGAQAGDFTSQSKLPTLPPAPPSFPSYRREYVAAPPVDDRKAQALAATMRSGSASSSPADLPGPSPPRTVLRPTAPRKPVALTVEQSKKPLLSLNPQENLVAQKSTNGHMSGFSGPRTDSAAQSEFGDESAGALEGCASDSDEWDLKIASLLKNLPKGVDEQAAKAILNEIVIRGDEVHWDDVAGLEIAKTALKEAVVYPFLRPDLFMGLREPARGMLLFGPPGTGKTMLARAVATESRSTFFAISASSLTSKYMGESEKLVRALFSLAKALAPSIIFVDEIDSLLSSRSGTGEHEATRRIKTEFLIQWSDLAKAAAGREDKSRAYGDATRVLVLAATNLPWAIDEAARRRFVRRQYIPLPESHVRETQLRKLMSAQKHGLSDVDFRRLVSSTDGFSGSDITALAKDAAMGPLRSLGENLLHMSPEDIRPIGYADFQLSMATIRPSVSRQGLKEYEDWAREFGERGG